MSTGVALRQNVQQRLRLLEIRRVKPLGKPLVYRRQQVVGLLALALGLPQARQAGGGTEFEGFGLLLTGHVEGLLETGFRLRRIRHRLLLQAVVPADDLCPLGNHGSG